ncbi:MAG TPA: GNAT family N-acetyltransferase [Pseudonocardiaceae bacterium]
MIRIDAVGPEHAGELFTVQRAAYLSEAQRYNAHIPPLRETLAEVLAEIDASDVLVFGAWLGTRLVGSVRGRPDGRDGMEVCRFAVAPDMQGRGVGRALLGALEAAVPAGVRRLWLVTGASSEDNLRMYRRSGYQPADEYVDDVGVRVLVLAKPAGGRVSVTGDAE